MWLGYWRISEVDEGAKAGVEESRRWRGRGWRRKIRTYVSGVTSREDKRLDILVSSSGRTRSQPYQIRASKQLDRLSRLTRRLTSTCFVLRRPLHDTNVKWIKSQCPSIEDRTENSCGIYSGIIQELFHRLSFSSSFSDFRRFSFLHFFLPQPLFP